MISNFDFRLQVLLEVLAVHKILGQDHYYLQHTFSGSCSLKHSCELPQQTPSIFHSCCGALFLGSFLLLWRRLLRRRRSGLMLKKRGCGSRRIRSGREYHQASTRTAVSYLLGDLACHCLFDLLLVPDHWGDNKVDTFLEILLCQCLFLCSLALHTCFVEALLAGALDLLHPLHRLFTNSHPSETTGNGVSQNIERWDVATLIYI